jgi:GTP-binding protein
VASALGRKNNCRKNNPDLKLLSADFVTSAAAGGRAEGIPRDRVPHVALAGRSNVGKSSLINALCRKRIARTSAAPGKTRLANVYRVGVEAGAGGPGRWDVYLVDLPGYGYARGGPDAAQELAAVAEGYFADVTARGVGRATLLLVDARHPGMDTDVDAAQWLRSLGIAPLIVATKIDKLSRADRARNLKALGDIFGTAALPVSATSGEGLDELWRLIARLARGEDERR